MITHGNCSKSAGFGGLLAKYYIRVSFNGGLPAG